MTYLDCCVAERGALQTSLVLLRYSRPTALCVCNRKWALQGGGWRQRWL